MLTKPCGNCGNEFPKLPSHSRKAWETRVKYCSFVCYHASRRGKPIAQFEGKRGTGRRRVNYASGPDNPRYTRITAPCLQCGRPFTFRAHRAGEAKFCTRRCAYDFRDRGLSTENEKLRQSPRYKEWRTRVFERDNYTCQECKTRGGFLNADHIKPFAFFPDLRFDVDNGRTLCAPCHRQTDTFGFRAWRNARKEDAGR